MSLTPHELEPLPEATRRLMHKACPNGTSVSRLRDALGPISHDEEFADLFPKRGRPAETPWRLALVLVLQAMENLTDRQAAQAVCLRLDGKYALSLAPEDEGFDFSILSDFRERLISQQAQERVLAPLVQLCRTNGWLKAGGKQRTASTHVLAAVRTLSSIERVGEPLRATLNGLGGLDASWVLSVLTQEWFDRYVQRVELARLPKAGTKREAWGKPLGQDVFCLLAAGQRQETPLQVRQAPGGSLLLHVWQQHYEVVDQEVRWRNEPAVSNEHRVVSPDDAEARSSRKREISWLGFQVHFPETCEEEEESIHLLTQGTTTPAPTPEGPMLSPLLDDLRQQDLAPASTWSIGATPVAKNWSSRPTWGPKSSDPSPRPPAGRPSNPGALPPRISSWMGRKNRRPVRKASTP